MYVKNVLILITTLGSSHHYYHYFYSHFTDRSLRLREAKHSVQGQVYKMYTSLDLKCWQLVGNKWVTRQWHKCSHGRSAGCCGSRRVKELKLRSYGRACLTPKAMFFTPHLGWICLLILFIGLFMFIPENFNFHVIKSIKPFLYGVSFFFFYPA